MMAHSHDTPSQSGRHLHTISLISTIFQEEYHNGSSRLGEILHDVVGLYQGSWPAYEACQVGYHTLQHSTDVALLVARIIVGWNRTDAKHFSQEHFITAVTTALFHDSGYIKDRGDTVGHGGKYTFTHVERSKQIMAGYLAGRECPASTIKQAFALLDATEFSQPIDLEGSYPDRITRQLAAILGTADLIAQMSDINYISNIHALFEEVEEAYTLIGRDKLQRQGHRIFESAASMLNETVTFYEQVIMPRLRQFGRVERYLINFFGNGRNPYLENIIANLTGQLLDKNSQWQRIGSILTSLGAISQDQLAEALRQQRASEVIPQSPPPLASFQKRFLNWSNGYKEQKSLGDILLSMRAINPEDLCQGLVAQILPPSEVISLNRERLELLLKITIMLHSACRDPWIFQQIISLAAAELSCAGGSILLAVPDRQEMIIAISTLLAKEHFEGKIIPADKGLAGWVYSHGQPAIVNAVDQDTRVEKSIDRPTQFPPESILAVPMCSNGNRFGVLEMFNKTNGFTDTDAALLVMVANVIAVALGAILTLSE